VPSEEGLHFSSPSSPSYIRYYFNPIHLSVLRNLYHLLSPAPSPFFPGLSVSILLPLLNSPVTKRNHEIKLASLTERCNMSRCVLRRRKISLWYFTIIHYLRYFLEGAMDWS